MTGAVGFDSERLNATAFLSLRRAKRMLVTVRTFEQYMSLGMS